MRGTVGDGPGSHVVDYGMLTVRPERRADHTSVRRVLELAFGPGSGEAGLVEALRASGHQLPELCLVAVDGDDVVGHIFFSRAQLASGDEALALAPMAVVPQRQREGVGSLLVDEALGRAARTGFPLVLVLGHSAYYPRFGFEPAGDLGVVAPWDVPAEAWMAVRLPAYRAAARGLVTYPPAFDAVT